MSSFIRCSVCNNKLENPKSLIAGIGPVCYEKILFTEMLNSYELETLEKKRENYNKNFIGRFLLLRKEDKMKAGIILKESSNNNSIYFFNRKKIDRNAESLTNSFLNAIETVEKNKINYVASITKSSSPDIRRAFKYFKKKLMSEFENLLFLEKDFNDKGLNTHQFHLVEKKEDMTQSQKINRAAFIKMREENPEVYSFYWKNGIYQRATLIYRLKNIEYEEARKFHEFLIDKKNSQFLELQTKDYGLTNEEIYNGLRNSNQKIESNLFKAFISGNPNFNLMLLIAKSYKKLNKTNKVAVYKFFLMLSNTNKKYNKDDLKKIFQ